MEVKDYLKRLEEIRKREFMSDRELVNELDIVHNTLLRIRRNPETCSLRTMKKIKRFVDEWKIRDFSEVH